MNTDDNNTENTEEILCEPGQTDSDAAIIKQRAEILKLLLIANVLVFLAIAMFMPVTTRKPAIYLYPEKTTQISVKTDKSIKLGTVIPKYTKNGWFVEAEPSGFLRDLQPEYTSCNKLPYKNFGFEYSKHACEINKYPYIYWDGRQTKKRLPKKKEGFIVKQENVKEFLTSKADEMNFSEAEKAEFVRYWLKTMYDKNYKYYKIYFLQNEEVQDYFPVYINPEPVNFNRVQIVIQKGKKNEKIEAQKLVPFERNGYTAVEWGGIIK